MSDHIPPADPAAQDLRPIDRNLLDLATTQARINPRRRALLRRNERTDDVVERDETDAITAGRRHVAQYERG